MNTVIERAPGESVFTHMSKLLDRKVVSETDTLRVVSGGITARTYKRVHAKLNFPTTLVAPETTVRRRLVNKSRFTQVESERLVRLVRVYSEAVQLFGDEGMALEWLNAPAEFLPGEDPITPMTLAATDAGARLVESHIRRTAHGIF